MYSDKHAIFRVSGPENRNTTVTQFGRVLLDLAIELICANSSEAKGRVKRANQSLTFQYDKFLYLMYPTEEVVVLPVKKLKYWIIPMAPSPSTTDIGALSVRHLISWPVSIRGRL